MSTTNLVDLLGIEPSVQSLCKSNPLPIDQTRVLSTGNDPMSSEYHTDVLPLNYESRMAEEGEHDSHGLRPRTAFQAGLPTLTALSSNLLIGNHRAIFFFPSMIFHHEDIAAFPFIFKHTCKITN